MRASLPITRAQTTALVTRLRDQTVPRLTADLARRQLAGVQVRQGAPYNTIVDGRENAPLDSVRFGGNIRFLFLDLGPVLDWIWEQLVRRSPVGPERGKPHYRAVHWLIIDGVWIPIAEAVDTMPITAKAIAMFVNARPYARAIEHGLSVQAPDGVYELVAAEARRRFPGTLIEFSYVSEGDIDVPIPWPVKATYGFPTITVRAAE